MLSFDKTNRDGDKTTITLIKDSIQGSRVLRSTLVTITTKEPLTVGEFAIRANNMVNLSNDDFEMLQDVDLNEDFEANFDESVDVW